MNTMEQIFLPASVITLVNLIAIVGGILYFKSKGGSQAAQDVINILNLRDVEQKQIILDYQKKFEDIKHELGILQGQIQEKDKKIEEYMGILQGRDPEQIQYMADMRKFTSGVATYMDSSTKSLKEVGKFMKELNQKSAESREWQKKREIDIPSRK